MKILGSDAYVELLLDQDNEWDEVFPSIRLNINASSQGFSGRTHVYVAVQDYKKFILEMQALEAERQGSAAIGSMSPGEFLLRLYSTDTVGHMAVEFRLMKYLIAGRTHWAHEMAFGFEIDPSLLPQLLHEFESLAA